MTDIAVNTRLRDPAIILDGKGYLGQIDAYTVPEALDMGRKELETSFSLINYDADVLALWGVVEGQMVALTIRGKAKSDDGTMRRAEHSLCGWIIKISARTLTQPDKPALTITLRLEFPSHQHEENQ